MKFVARMFATIAVAFLLASSLHADDAPKPGSATKAVAATDKYEAANSRVAPAAASAAAPAAPAPTPVPQSGLAGFDTPRVELFLGYSNVPDVLSNRANRIADLNGGDMNIAFNLNRYFGLVGDFAGYHANTLTFFGGNTSRDLSADGKVFTYMGGPRLSFRRPRYTLFAQALFGDANARKVTVDGCTGSPFCTPLPSENVFAMALGGGLDVNVHRHFALRIIQAEYLMTRFKDPSSSAGTSGTRNNLRLSAGIVFRFGSMGEPPVSPSAACSVQPAEVFAGEPVNANASESNFRTRRSVAYRWHGTGVKVAGSDASTQVETAGLQPGSYVVTADLTDGDGSASCSSRFTVKESHPPVISCSADPASVQTGGTSTINSNASSPDGRRVSYSYTATAGDISGDDYTGTLNTRGAEPGRVTVTCNARDDRDPPLTASSTTTVNVEAPPPLPPPPPAPEIRELEARLELHSIYFQTARPNELNPNGGLLPSQEQILITLAEDYRKYLKYRPDAHLILGGHADQRGSAEYNKSLTGRRVERTKQFLVEHNVPAGHIETRSFGDEQPLNSLQVKEQIAQNPDLTPADRQQMLGNLRVMVLANNRRVDVSLSTTGQQSTHHYPFNARDYLALISTKGGEKKPPAKKKP